MKTYNLKQAAEFCHEGESTLRKKAKLGKIKFHKPGRQIVFFEEDLMVYLKGSKAS